MHNMSEGLEKKTEASGINDRPEKSTTTVEALTEEYKHKDYTNKNRGVVGG